MGLLTTLDRLFGNAYNAVESAIENIDRKASKLPKHFKKLRRRSSTINEIENIDVADGKSRRFPETGARSKYQCTSEKGNETGGEDKLAKYNGVITINDIKLCSDHKLYMESKILKRYSNESEQVQVDAAEVGKSLNVNILNSTYRESKTHHSYVSQAEGSFHSNVQIETGSPSTSSSMPRNSVLPLIRNTVVLTYQIQTCAPADQTETCIVATSPIETQRSPIYPADEAISAGALHSSSLPSEISPSSQSQTEPIPVSSYLIHQRSCVEDGQDNETYGGRKQRNVSRGIKTSRQGDESYGGRKQRYVSRGIKASRKDEECHHGRKKTNTSQRSETSWQDDECHDGRKQANTSLGSETYRLDDESYEGRIQSRISQRIEAPRKSDYSYDSRRVTSYFDGCEPQESSPKRPTETKFTVSEEGNEIGALDKTNYEVWAEIGLGRRDEKGCYTGIEDNVIRKLTEIRKFTCDNSIEIEASSEGGDCQRDSTPNNSEKIKLVHGTALDSLDGDGSSNNYRETEKKAVSRTSPAKKNIAWSINEEESTEPIEKREKVHPFGKFDRGSWCLWAVPKKPHSRVLAYACKHKHKKEQVWRNGFPYPDEKDQSYWYHGTSIISALNIIENGIQLELGHVRQDFSHGDGFYLSPCLQNAWKWAVGVHSHEAAVVVFKLTFNLKSFWGLDLTLGFHEWQTIVRYNRSGREVESDGELFDWFENCDYVLGPINGGKTGSKSVDGNWLKWNPSGFKNPFRQLCVRSEKLARQFSEVKNIESVIIY